jgi:hypothetical protein
VVDPKNKWEMVLDDGRRSALGAWVSGKRGGKVGSPWKCWASKVPEAPEQTEPDLQEGRPSLQIRCSMRF